MAAPPQPDPTRSDDERSPRPSLLARGAVAGAVAGALAGAVDYLVALRGAAQFLPDGSFRLALFLAALYAGLAAVGGAILLPVGGLVVRLTDLGPLASSAFSDEAARRARREAVATDAPPTRLGAPWLAYAAGGLLAFVGLGAAVYAVALHALLRFHHHLLIAALVAAAASGLALLCGVFALVVAAAVAPLLRFGPRPRLALGAAPAWHSAFHTLGLLAAAGVLLLLVDRIALLPRLTAEQRARAIAQYAPPLIAFALLLSDLAARATWRGLVRRRGGTGWGWLNRPAATLLAPLGLIGLALALVVGAKWSLVVLLPWKPFVAAAAIGGGLVVATLAGWGRWFDTRALPLRGAPLVGGLLLVLLGVRLGDVERVRKAAIAHAGLAGPIIGGLHALSDFDRDGHAAWFGADCNDFNAEVHPGAFDWPDDGVDQNCNGHQATAKPLPRPPFHALPPAAPKRPNVFLLSIDALRADHLGSYGYPRPTSPRLDALARQAILFRNGWAHSPSTRYSVPAILSGRYESTIAWGSPAQHWPPPVLPENRLLAEMFKQHGYRTAAFLPYHYFEREWGVDQGFDDYDYSLSRLHANPFNGDPARTTGSSSRELADLGIAYIDAHKSEPMFVWMHFYDPHFLYESHPEVTDFGASDLDRYDNEIAFTDLHVGRLLDHIRAAGLWDDSIIIVTADHGEGLGEHGINQHGYHIYVQQNKVPFIVRAPGFAPRVVDEAVGHVDLFPSLLNLLQAPDEPQLLGRSFVDLMLGESSPRRVFGEVEYEGPVVRKSVATRDWHLIHNVIPDNTFELYHLTVDPQAAHDLAGSGEPAEAELRAALGEWMDQSALPADFASRVAGNLSAAPLPYAVPLAADLDGLLVLDGVDVKTPSVKPGGDAEIAIIMHAARPIPEGWRLFTHVVPADGRFLNADHQPVEGFVPLQRLRVGQSVRDRIRVAIPEGWSAGEARFEVGLFRGRERAKVRSAKAGDRGDHVVAATIRIEPR